MKKRMTLYNKKTYEKVNENNKMLLEDYMADLTIQGKSKATCYQYKADIRAFLCWLVKHYHNASVLKVKKRVYRMFFLQLINNQTSHNRINRLESSLRNFIEFAVDSDDYDIDKNPMAQIKGMQKKLVRKIVFLSDDEITTMINYCLKHHKYQIALYASLSYDSGARRREVLGVKKDALKSGHITNKVHGKEGKVFPLLFFSRSKKIYNLWMKQRGNDNVDSLWRTKENGHYKAASYQTLYYWVRYLRKVLYKETGTMKYFNCHSFRHSCAENMTNGDFYALKDIGRKNISLSVIQLVLHHSSLDMTKSYLKDHSKQKVANAFKL